MCCFQLEIKRGGTRMKLEIKEDSCEKLGSSYHVYLNGEFFRYCKYYSELAKTIGSLVKANFKREDCY